MYNHLSSFCQQ